MDTFGGKSQRIMQDITPNPIIWYNMPQKENCTMIGRTNEIAYLRSAYNSDHSEFVAVYGRRRIGKTFLINEVFNYRFAFHAAGNTSGNQT